jgi:hypothetical protein
MFSLPQTNSEEGKSDERPVNFPTEIFQNDFDHLLQYLFGGLAHLNLKLEPGL